MTTPTTHKTSPEKEKEGPGKHIVIHWSQLVELKPELKEYESKLPSQSTSIEVHRLVLDALASKKLKFAGVIDNYRLVVAEKK